MEYLNYSVNYIDHTLIFQSPNYFVMLRFLHYI